MKAMVMTRFGPPSVLQLRDVAKPVPKDNEVLVKVRGTSVFVADCEMRAMKVGLALRLPVWIYMRFFRPQPIILGQELAGEIEAVGAAVTKFRVGDAVYGATSLSLGGYAQYKCVPETPGPLDGALALKPANLDYAEAAAVPVGGLEALHFIRKANIQPGEQMLINGAGGSIGTMAVQLAKRQGAEITAVDSAIKLTMLRTIGAAHVLDYAAQDFTRLGQRYDVILDVVGTSPFARSMDALKPGGRYLIVNPRLTHRLHARRAPAGDKTVFIGTGPQRAADLAHLKDLIEAGQLKPVIDRRYPLEQLAEAHRYVDTGGKVGNVVVDVAHAA